MLPETTDQLEKYLASGFIKGVGPATAKKIVKKFKDETMDILKRSPEKLSTIKGITFAKAEEICNAFNENLSMWEIVGFLEKYSISATNATTIYKTLGPNAISKIEENPYILINLGIRADFNIIDKMAINVGIEKTNLKRIGAGIIYSLKLAAFNGHTCVLKKNLITYITMLLGISEEDAEEGIKDLLSKQQLYLEEKYDDNENQDKEPILQQWIYLKDLYETEVSIASRTYKTSKSRQSKKS